jgi:DNA-binding beta-propeller fold protein YncE
MRSLGKRPLWLVLVIPAILLIAQSGSPVVPVFYILSAAGGGSVGDGNALEAGFVYPWDIAKDTDGNIYITDGNHRIRVLNMQGTSITIAGVRIDVGHVQTIAGTGVAGFSGDGGPATQAQLNRPFFITVDDLGNVYFSEFGNRYRVRCVSTDGIIDTVAGTGVEGYSGDGGPAKQAMLSWVRWLAYIPKGLLLISDRGRIRAVNVTDLPVTYLGFTIEPGNIQTLFGGTGYGIPPDGTPITQVDRRMYVHSVDPLEGRENNLYLVGCTSCGEGSDDLTEYVFYANTLDTPVTIYPEAPGGGITVQPGTVRLIAGGGTSAQEDVFALDAFIPVIAWMDVDHEGNIYYTQYNPPVVTRRIRRVDGLSGVVRTAAGTGEAGWSPDGTEALKAKLGLPSIVCAVDKTYKGEIIFAETINNRIRVIDDGILKTIAGTGFGGFSGDDALSYTASLAFPWDIEFDGSGNMFVADLLNRRVFMVDPDGNLTTLVGNGVRENSGDGGKAIDASIIPLSIALDLDGNVYIGTYGAVRVINMQATPISFPDTETTDIVIQPGCIDRIAGTGVRGFNVEEGLPRYTQLSRVDGLAVDVYNNIYMTDSFFRIRVMNPSDKAQRIAGVDIPARRLKTLRYALMPAGITLDSARNIYFSQTRWSLTVMPECVKRIDAQTGQVTLIAGSGVSGFSGDGGPATQARLQTPVGLVVDPSTGNIFIADCLNHRIRMVEAVTGNIYTVAGNGEGRLAGDGGLATEASLRMPRGIAQDPGTGRIWIADSRNNRVRVLDEANVSPGLNVTVSPIPGITFTFDQVTVGGFLGVLTSLTGPDPPEGFKVGDPKRSIYYSVVPGVIQYTGNITIRINYDREFGEDSIRLFRRLRLYQYIEDRWYPIGDELFNTFIQGTTQTLSIFKVFLAVYIEASIKIKPEVVNLRAKGVFSAYIRLPDDIPLDLIEPGSLSANGEPAMMTQLANKQFFIAKFKRHVIKKIGNGLGEVTIYGRLKDGRLFRARAVVPILK